MESYGRVIFTLGLTLVLLTSCGWRFTRGSGNITSEERPVSDFTAVDFSGYGEMVITQGESESLTIETDDNLLRNIKTTVNQGKLTIEFENDFWLPSMRPTSGIRYELTVKDLNALELSGAGTIEMDELDTDELSLEDSGAGQIKIDQLTATELNVEISGAGSIEVAGEVTNQSVELSGLGSYEGGDLASETADIELSGAGSATVWVTESLDAEISGVGGIRYYGSPQLHSESSGIGEVESLGNK